MAVLNAHLVVIPELARGLYQAIQRAKSYFGPCALVSRSIEAMFPPDAPRGRTSAHRGNSGRH
jgi:hypothetical protein